MATAQEIYRMAGNENLWQVAALCHRSLQDARIPHSVRGGVAVCLHGYQRNTVDIDLIIRRNDTEAVRAAMQDAGLVWNETNSEFLSPNGIPVQFLYAGDKAGRDSEVLIPSPEGEFNVEIVDDLPVLRLSKLIEIKIACGLSHLRRTHKDLADVVELIAVRKLDSSFAKYLHKSVRPTFRELIRNARSTD